MTSTTPASPSPAASRQPENRAKGTPSSDKRPRLRDIVRGNAADFNRTWNETEASSGFDPLPPGVYRALITDGRSLHLEDERNARIQDHLRGH